MRSLRSVAVLMILVLGLLAAGCGGGAAERRVDELEVRVGQLRTEVDQLLGASAPDVAREVVATGSAGSLLSPDAPGGLIVPQDPPAPVLDGPSLATNGTPAPDLAGAVLGDDGSGPLPLGSVTTLPASVRLDFLFEFCWFSPCFRDAHFMDPAGSGLGSGVFTADMPFYIREGFVNTGDEPLAAGFDVAVYVTQLSAPREHGGRSVAETYRYTSDYVIRGTSEACGPTYETQTGPVTCEWFVHEFKDGLPAGRHAIWAVWEAPCSAWLDYGFTGSCPDPNEIISMFSSGFDAPFRSSPPNYSEVNEANLSAQELAARWQSQGQASSPGVFYECTSDEPPEGVAPPAGSGEGSPQIPIAAVTLHGAAFMERGNGVEEFKWGCGFVVEPESLIDGLFFPRSQYWDEGAVWWDSGDGRERWIELDLGGTFTIDAAIVQADDNDSYLLSYRDPETGEWVAMWSIPPAYGFGMQTRPDPGDDSARQRFDPPVATDRLRFEADQGDNGYSVSEIQVFGTGPGATVGAAGPAGIVGVAGPAEYDRVLAVSALDMWVVAGQLICRLQFGLPRVCYGLAGGGRVNGLAAAADGTVWAATDLGLLSFDGAQWRSKREWGGSPVGGVVVGPDGTVWFGGWSEEGDGVDWPWLVRWDGGSWVGADRNTEFRPAAGRTAPMAVTPDGVVWIFGGTPVPRLARFDGTIMEEVPIGDYPAGAVDVTVMTAAPNGDLWLIGETGPDPNYPLSPNELVVARLSNTGWTVIPWHWDDPDGGLAARLRRVRDVAVGPDGGVWFGADFGLASYNGSEWTIHIEGRGVWSLDIGPDGTVWYADDYGAHAIGGP